MLCADAVVVIYWHVICRCSCCNLLACYLQIQLLYFTGMFFADAVVVIYWHVICRCSCCNLLACYLQMQLLYFTGMLFADESDDFCIRRHRKRARIAMISDD